MPAWKCLRLVVPVFAVVAFSAAGCGPGSSSSSPPPPAPGAPSTTAPVAGMPAPPTAPAKITPDVKITAEEFYKETRKDTSYLITKHAGKLVEMTGVVEEGMLSFGGDPLLMVKGGTGFADLVNCPISDRNPWAKAFPGQTVTLWGRAPASAADPKPFVWEIKSATGPQPPRIAAEAFLKEFLDDTAAAEKKYNGKPIILTGEVAEPRMHVSIKDMLVGFRLGPKEKKPAIVCFVAGLGGKKELEFVRSVAKPGQKVTLIVAFNGRDADEIGVNGHILEPAY